jgi:Na+/H+ antiporter NhaD/arsenite permease-like protein
MLKKLGAGIAIVIVLAALFGNRKISSPESVPRIASIGGSNAVELSVINVNPVIARQFRLKGTSGVLINDIPRGTLRRRLGLKRGDVILKYNRVDVQSANHLVYLMSQGRIGDTVRFLISRQGKLFSVTAKIPQTAGGANLGYSAGNILIALIILILIFSALFFNLINRTVCVALGAALMLFVGSLFGFYDQTKAFHSIKMGPIIIFIGMSAFSILLEELKFFEYLAKKMILRMKADAGKVVFVLCLMTYLFSLFVNNLSIILVMIPVTLYVARGLNINPVPVVIAEIISSNIGGASTVIGDFPNMLISASTGLTFIDFFVFMAPVCFILLLSLLWFLRRFGLTHNNRKKSTAYEKAFLKKIEIEVSGMRMDWKAIRKTLFILGCTVIGFIILPIFRIGPAFVALAGGFLLLGLTNKKASQVLKRMSFTDVIFFISLFIIVGGALYAGLLKGISDIIISLSSGNKTLYLILLMWIAALLSAFLNAGPATVFFIPIVLDSHFAGFSDTAWWALSLGVLAGSSATITGATAGVVTQTLLSEYNWTGLDGKDKYELTFANFSQRGIPVALMFLAISSVYIIFLCSIAAIK